MNTYKKGEYISVLTNQPQVYFSRVANSGLKPSDIEPEEYVAKVKSVIGNGDAYFVFIPSIGFRCVVDKSEVLASVSEDELTDDERNNEDWDDFTAPNVYVCKDKYEGMSDKDRCLSVAAAAMEELFPDDKVVSIEQCHSDFLKSDLIATIDHLLKVRHCNNCMMLIKFDHFKKILQHLRFKEYYCVRVGIEDEQEEGVINYAYLAVSTIFDEVSVMRDLSSDLSRFTNSLGPEYDSAYRFLTNIREGIMSF